MSKLYKKGAVNYHTRALYGLTIVLIGVIAYFNWMIGAALALILFMTIYNSVRTDKQIENDTEKYISTLSYRVKKVGEEALHEMPIGILLFSEDYEIEWANPFVNLFTEEEDTLVGQDLNAIYDDFIASIKEDKTEVWFQHKDRTYQAMIKREERLIYFFDKTEQVEIETLYKNEQTVLGIIFLDNYEEVTQAMDDTTKSHLNSKMTSILNEWSRKNDIYLKRTSQERFLAVMNLEILNRLEKEKFEVLDEVRELISDKNVPLTLSIGVGIGHESSLREIGELAQSSLDLALGRGGDQVAIKDETGKVKFFGGKTNPMEKRTRVRARVISHALKELVKESDKVMVMGHKSPDMDSIGAGIGILKVAQANDKDGFVIFDPDGVNTGVERLMDMVQEDESLSKWFISPDDSLDIVTKNTLLVVVDTHKPSMVMDERLLTKTDHVVVIDHHRRAEEFIDDPTLVYMEPYASSTAELVTELLEYQPSTLKLNINEATSLLAGMIVDTKYFTLRTGSRTFDAASYLRLKGADTVLVQKLLEEDLDVYVRRSQLIERAEVYQKGIAIVRAEEGQTYGPILIAQAADTLLTMSGIKASFVISERDDDKIGISARSLGDINVQIIMEQMNGGGHLTNAATQIGDTTVYDAEEQLKEIIDEYLEGREDK
ncbi:DHH family phosphoesterase [Virgibacillus sp. MSP4-1]|uniref:DHH family phosphoesterase n=1 Tax=Virgibacillus sp. MSP4-1 TaxID=2700081 RepID=UPI0003A85707|nr:DHH family phosphoesterase [Virgibacillus sp. MSP4-1]QHS23815.1 DHH family phosphoesterase [Virgibacillus sp. MSP4-1]